MPYTLSFWHKYLGGVLAKPALQAGGLAPHIGWGAK